MSYFIKMRIRIPQYAKVRIREELNLFGKKLNFAKLLTYAAVGAIPNKKWP